MLTLLIQINGVTIDRIDVVNRGRVSGDIDRHLYEWQTPGANGYVTHHRDDGAAVLIQRVIAELLAQQTIDATNTDRKSVV